VTVISDASLSNLVSGGALALATTAGSLTTLSSGAITAAGNLLLQAGGAGSDLDLGADVSSTHGVLTAKAADRIDLSADVVLTAAASASLTAASITMEVTSGLVSQGGNLRMQTAGGMTLGHLEGIDVSLLAGSSINSATGSDRNVDATRLRMQAGEAIGVSGKPIKMAVTTLSALAEGNGARGVFLQEADSIRIDTVAVDVTEFNADGSTSLLSDVAQADLVAGNTGVLVLTTTDGVINLVDGNGDGRAVSAGGNLLLQAGGIGGDIIGTAAIRSAGGHLTVQAAHALLLAADVETSGNGDINLEALTGGMFFAPDADVRTGSGDIRVVSKLDITLGGVIQTSGNIALTSVSGNILDGDNDAGIDLEASGLRLYAGGGIGVGSNANPVEIAVTSLSAKSLNGDISLLERDGLTVASNGVTVSVMKVAESGGITLLSEVPQIGVVAGSGRVYLTSQIGQIVLDEEVDGQGEDVDLVGDLIDINQPLPGSGGTLTIQPNDPGRGIQIGDATAVDLLWLGHDDLGNILDGFRQIVIGSGSASVAQEIRLVGVQQELVFLDPLLLDATGAGSFVHLEGGISAETIASNGPVQISGTVNLAAGQLAFSQSLDGEVNAQVNRLNVDARNGDVLIGGVVGGSQPLDGLIIDNADDVTFSQAVTLTGDLMIHASGIVRFDGPLDLNGGTLTIIGASQVILGGGTIGLGVIRSDGIQVLAGLQGGSLQLHANDPARTINLGGANLAGAYNISAASLANLAGLSGLVIGERGGDGHTAVDAGDVHIAAIDLSGFATRIDVHGNHITVENNPNGNLLLGNGLNLEALGNIRVEDSIATARGDMRMVSLGGDISMTAGSQLTAQGDSIELRADGNLILGGVDAQGSQINPAGRVVLQSLGGQILDADQDDAVNVRGEEVLMRGLGAGQGQNALEVEASRISVAAGGGVVYQDVTPDGNVHYMLMRGGLVYEQLVSLDDAVRVTDTPDPRGDDFVGGPVNALPPSAQATGGLFGNFWSGGTMAAVASAHTAEYLSQYSGAVTLDRGDSLLSDHSYGLGSAYTLLGSPGMQTWSTGEAANDEEAFDYWIESLAL